jgi:type I restriction enzyme M protein
MSEEQKKVLERQLWQVANVLRGKMNADEYKNYILGFIFYKYLSEKLQTYVDHDVLASDPIKYHELTKDDKETQEILSQISNICIENLGFFIKPTELFSYLVSKGKGNVDDQDTFILEDLKKNTQPYRTNSHGNCQ